MKYIVKPAITLLITAVITVAALSVVYNLTLEPIERQKFKTQETAMREILPRATEYREMQIEKTGSIVSVYEGLYASQALTDSVTVGYVLLLSPEGYSGKIDIIVGIAIPYERITGIRIIRHSETPGLGALAVKRNFFGQFDSRYIIPLSVVRSSPGENEIQAITSSTITSRAITYAVNEAMEWYISTKRIDEIDNEHNEGDAE